MSDHGPSIKKPRMYEALRRKGYSKAKAARISNAAANGTLDRSGRKGAHALEHAKAFAMATNAGRRSGGQGGRGRSNVAFARHGKRGGGSARGNASARAGRVTRGRG